MKGQGAELRLRIADRQRAWVERLPDGVRASAELARWDRPIGTWLLLWPCWWGLALAPGPPSLWLVLLFGIGAIAMRGAGCTINDLADRKFDAKVARTRNRPLPSGRISVPQAFAFLAAQLLVGLAVLAFLNANAVWLAFAIMPVVMVYPFMKRITYWPQAFLAICFNWGAVVGWTAAAGALAWPAVALYLAGMAWTLGYDTIYAHQDKEDDALIGVKSTALLFRERTPAWIAAFYGTMLALLAITGILAGLGWLFWPALALAALALWRQARGLDIDDAGACLAAFRNNRVVGLLVFVAILAGKLPV